MKAIDITDTTKIAQSIYERYIDDETFRSKYVNLRKAMMRVAKIPVSSLTPSGLLALYALNKIDPDLDAVISEYCQIPAHYKSTIFNSKKIDMTLFKCDVNQNPSTEILNITSIASLVYDNLMTNQYFRKLYKLFRQASLKVERSDESDIPAFSNNEMLAFYVMMRKNLLLDSLLDDLTDTKFNA